ncbi:MAG TPA: type I polyketide synthase [Ideonella sp.]|nr:type I polyketide synthase [Ideonella sp.]
MKTADTATVRPEQRLLEKLLREKYEPIAIVGMGHRFPGGNDTPAGFAEFLRAGRCGTGPIPPDRWDVAGLATTDAKAPGKIRTEGGGFLDGIDQFDARFFNIAPKEANYIDPQQRLILECAWAALEHANIDPHSLKDSDGGVYIGIACVDYTLEVESLPYEQLDGHIGTGTSHSSVAGRLSFFLGLRGPCVALDTACSSSLVSLHLAVQGLRRGECSLALAGGVNAVHHPRHHIIFTQANMLAADGRCKTFDERADGYGRSEGCGVLVLKRLSDALRDGDSVLALVRGSAIAQDGESAGLTVPSGSAQEMVMRRAMDSAMLAPADIQYVEAHGTGTPLGDPIEIAGIHGVFGASHGADAPLLVGSVKTNLGHMEAAAGVGGLVKTVLQLQAGEIFPHLHFETPSSRIPWERYAVAVPTETRPWPGKTRRALVNSFGFSGIIASVLLEQAPARAAARLPEDSPDAPAAAEPQLFTLSAKSRTALLAMLRQYRAALPGRPADAADEPAARLALAELCRATRGGRAHFAHRIAGVVRSWAELDKLLAASEASLQESAGAEAPARQAQRVAWLFTGQGAQYPGMGLALYRRFPVFRQEVDALDALFAPLLQRSIRALMFGEDADAAQALGQTAFTQPALFTLELATARLWQSFGVAPSVLMGHSIGELAAATVAGVFSLADAVKVVAERGRLMQSVSRPGGMLAVSAAPQQVSPLLHGQADVVIAAFNAPTQCVVSGSLDGLEAVGAALKAKGLASKPLPVSHAFHSPLMTEVFPAFRAAFDGVVLNEPALTMMSNVSGATASARELRNPDYWVRHIGEPVRFTAGMQGVAARGKHLFIELGPAPVLTALGRQCVSAAEHGWVASMKAGEAGTASLLEALAQLYLAGAAIAWRAVDAGQPRPQLALPHYPFERKRHWLPVAKRHALPAADTAAAGHPLLGRAEPAGADGVHLFSQRLSARQPAYLADHVVMGQVIFPGAGYVELLLAAQDAVLGEAGREIRGLAIHEALILRDDAFTRVQTRVSPRADGGHDVAITSLQEGVAGAVERQHASAVLAPWADDGVLDQLAADLRGQVAQAGAPRSRREAEQLYADYQAIGLFYGPAFQQLQSVEVLGDRLAVGTLAAPAGGPELLPPALLDAAFQSMAGLLDSETTYLPVGFERLRLGKKPRGAVRSLVRLAEGVPGDDATLRFDLLLLEAAPGGERVVFSVAGLTLKQASSGAARRMVHGLRWLKRSLPQSAGRPAVARQVLAVGLAPQRLAALQALAPDGALRLQAVDAVEAVPAALRAHDGIADIAWFWQPQPALQGLARLQAESEANYRALLALAQGLEREFYDRKLRLWLVTSGALSLPGDAPGSTDDSLAAASAWGFGAVWLNEQPKLRVTLLDLDAAAPDELVALVQEWGPADSAAETRIAWRGGQRHVQRVVAPREPGAGNFRLAVREPGGFANVLPEPITDAAPAADEVTVEMRSAGLNFKDVLNALGLLKQHADDTGQAYQPLPLGFEGAGVVAAAGAQSGYAPGDEVIVNHLGCMQRRVTLPALALVRKPAALSFTEAAGLPAAYVTASYALHTLAGLRKGDKVLIHAAAGGVGQAAVHLAHQVGAEVFATASPRKWPLLRSQGVKHLMNSRTLDFAVEIERLTGGAGVDVVLNSLNKDYIPAGLGVLARGGRFVELGKVGVWSAGEVRALRPDVAYHNFDLSEFEPQALLKLNHELLSRVVADVEAGRLPALATTAYAMDEVEEAFAVLSRGANTGKLVLRFDEPAAPPPAARAIDPEAVYVVTGGFGALGEWTARTLVAMGVRHLALVARSLPDAAALDALRQRLGPLQSWLPLQADVAEPADVARLQQALAATGRPLGAIVHAAGVLRDKPVLAQDWAGIEAVLRPKVYGGWLLHRMAAALPGNAMLVGFSSVAAVVGAAGQANYAAANSFLDALAHWRAAQGRPSLSINWGPFAEVGMAARMESAQVQAVEGKGFKFIRPREGMRQLRGLWTGTAVQAVVGEVDWGRVASQQSAGAALYAQVAGDAQASAVARFDVEALAELPRAERSARLNALVRGCIARLLHFDSPDDIAPDTPFAEVGLDSLEGVELANALEEALQMPLPGSIIFDAPAIPLLTEFLVNALEQRGAGKRAAASDTAPSEAPA